MVTSPWPPMYLREGGSEQGSHTSKAITWPPPSCTHLVPEQSLPLPSPLFHALGSGGHADVGSELQWPLEDWRHDTGVRRGVSGGGEGRR